MRRFFYALQNVLKVGQIVDLTDDIFQHWCKVLRAETGDMAVFFDGSGGEYQAVLQSMDKKSATALITDFSPINRNSPLEVGIGLVMSRGERMDYAIQKACEMGVSTIQLLTSQHGEVRLKSDQIPKKLAHWQGVATSACEQCGLNLVPAIFEPIPISDFIHAQSQNSAIKLVLSVPERLQSEQIFSFAKFDKNKAYSLLIGAEGGLSDNELQQAYEQGFLAWQLGERVLRTETAPVVALSYLQAFYTSTTNLS